MRTELGKISVVSVGLGGYQDAQLGISFTLSGNGWGVCDFWGHWGFPPSPSAKWTTAEQINYLGETFLRIGKLLEEAKVTSVDRLKNIPIQVTFDGNSLKSWRVLKEVL